MSPIRTDDSDEGIIELTDIVKEGDPAKMRKADDDPSSSIDFDKELDDLFAEADAKPAAEKAGAAAGDDFDLAGLDDMGKAAGSPKDAPGAAPKDDLDLSDLGITDDDLNLDAPADAGKTRAKNPEDLDLEGLDDLLDDLQGEKKSLGDALPDFGLDKAEGAPEADGKQDDDLPDLGDLSDLPDFSLEDEPKAADATDAMIPAEDAGTAAATTAAAAAPAGESEPSGSLPADVAGRLAAMEERLAVLEQKAAEPAPGVPEQDRQALLDETTARMEELLSEHSEFFVRLRDVVTEDLTGSLLPAIEDRITARLEAFKDDLALDDLKATMGLDVEKRIEALRGELMDEIERAVPQAAADIIREEIRALADELGE